jgi:hypothetical protein
VLEVGELHRAAFVAERGGPFIEHPADRNVIGDPEREVQVGEAIAATDRERTYGRSGHDPLILLRES